MWLVPTASSLVVAVLFHVVGAQGLDCRSARWCQAECAQVQLHDLRPVEECRYDSQAPTKEALCFCRPDIEAIEGVQAVGSQRVRPDPHVAVRGTCLACDGTMRAHAQLHGAVGADGHGPVDGGCGAAVQVASASTEHHPAAACMSQRRTTENISFSTYYICPAKKPV
jgi:hypothetical protein